MGHPGINLLGDDCTVQNRYHRRVVCWFVIGCELWHLDGITAVGMVLVIYIIHIQHQGLRVASLLQQALVVFVLLFVKQLLILWVDGMLGRAPGSWLYFMPTITSTLLWLWIYLILKDLHRKFSVNKTSLF
ncbi:MAG: rod shape-determining protein MreD [Gammaproteobacteria bacterium]